MLQLTTQDCEEILRNRLKTDEFEIKKVKISKKTGFYGFLGEYFRLEIEVQNQRKEKFFVKSISITNEKQRKFLKESGIFKKEVDLYEKLIPKLKNCLEAEKWCPDCYLTKDDFIVFEDLEQSNYFNLPAQIEFQENHILRILKTLASFHASSLIYQEKEKSSIEDEFKDILNEISFAPEVPWCITGFKALAAVATEKSKYSNNNEIRETFYTKLFKLFDLLENSDPQFTGPKVFSQRDYWRNNFMFKFDCDENGNFDYFNPKSCVFVDFQTARFCPLVIDVLFAIIINTRRSHHQQKIHQYLQYYHKELGKFVDLERILPYKKFLESCDYFTLVPLIINPICLSLTLLPKDLMENLNNTNPEKFQQICNGDRKGLVFECIENDPFYKECLLEAVEELVEYLYFNKSLI